MVNLKNIHYLAEVIKLPRNTKAMVDIRISEDILSRDSGALNCHTNDDRRAWFAIDLGKSFRLVVN